MPHSSGCIEVEVASNFWKSSNENQGTFESETLAGILTCSLRGGTVGLLLSVGKHFVLFFT